MATATMIKRVTGRSYSAAYDDAADEAVLSELVGSVGPRSLWEDAAATTIDIGGGAGNTAVAIGGAATTSMTLGSAATAVGIPGDVTIGGDLTVNGTTTTVNTTNLTVSDSLIYANDGGLADSSGGIAWDQGGEDDAVLLFNGGFNAGEGRFELGRADTTGGTVTPANLATFSDLKVGDLALAGTTLTADAGLTIAATAANLTLAATGANSVQVQTNGVTQWSVDSAGDLLTAAGNNIGDVGNTARPANVYVGTSVVVGATVTIATASIAGSAGLSVDAAAALSLGGTNATSVTVGRTGVTTTVPGALAVTQTSGFTGLADFDAGLTIAAAQAITGDGALTIAATSANLTLNALTGGSVQINGNAFVDLSAANNDIRLITNSQTRWTVANATGNLLAGTDNSFSIGAAGANRPSSVHAATSVVVAQGGVSQVTISSGSIAAAAALSLVAAGANTVSLTGHATAIPLNTAGDPTLDTTAQDLVGAINEAFAAAGGVQTLAQTLAAGNTTGGTDIVVSDADDLVMGSGAGASNILWNAAASGNIGNVAQTQSPDNIYAATSVVVGTTVTITTNSIAGSAGLSVDAAAAITVGGTSATSVSVGRTGVTTTIPGALAVTQGSTFTALADFDAGLTIAAAQAITGDGALTIASGGAAALALNTASGTLTTNATLFQPSGGMMIRPSSGVLDISSGGGNDLRFFTNATLRWYVDGASGHFVPNAALDNQVDLGATGARARTGYFGTSVVTPLVTRDTGDLTISTTTSGNISVTSVGTVTVQQAAGSTATFGNLSGASVTQLNGGTGGVTIRASDIFVGDVADDSDVFLRAGPTSPLTFTARGGTTVFNQVGQTSLHTSYTTASRDSVIGALNALVDGTINLTANFLTATYTNANAGAITVGQAVYISATNSVDLAAATSDNAAARLVGFVGDASIASTASGRILTEGVQSLRFVAGLTLNPGDEVFLSTTTGSVTNVAPATAGNVVLSVGFVKDVLTYDGVGDFLASVQLVRGSKIVV